MLAFSNGQFLMAQSLGHARRRVIQRGGSGVPNKR
jgi:hypothetical protein